MNCNGKNSQSENGMKEREMDGAIHIDKNLDAYYRREVYIK